jgi:hypothetical protein
LNNSSKSRPIQSIALNDSFKLFFPITKATTSLLFNIANDHPKVGKRQTIVTHLKHFGRFGDKFLD